MLPNISFKFLSWGRGRGVLPIFHPPFCTIVQHYVAQVCHEALENIFILKNCTCFLCRATAMLFTTRFNQALGISILASGRGLILICACDDIGAMTET